MSRADHIWDGDTWWMVNSDCPECGAPVASNGNIHDCKNCEWWDPTYTDNG